MCTLCFVLTNSVLLNLLCAWILIFYMTLWSLQSLNAKTWKSLWQFNLTHAWQMLQLKISAWQPLDQLVEQSACAFSLQSKWTTTQSDQLGAAIKQEQCDWSRHHCQSLCNMLHFKLTGSWDVLRMESFSKDRVYRIIRVSLFKSSPMKWKKKWLTVTNLYHRMPESEPVPTKKAS